MKKCVELVISKNSWRYTQPRTHYSYHYSAFIEQWTCSVAHNI